jgi:hypothetical protein
MLADHEKRVKQRQAFEILKISEVVWETPPSIRTGETRFLSPDYLTIDRSVLRFARNRCDNDITLQGAE